MPCQSVRAHRLSATVLRALSIISTFSYLALFLYSRPAFVCGGIAGGRARKRGSLRDGLENIYEERPPLSPKLTHINPTHHKSLSRIIMATKEPAAKLPLAVRKNGT
jgi:hypothetical protein